MLNFSYEYHRRNDNESSNRQVTKSEFSPTSNSVGYFLRNYLRRVYRHVDICGKQFDLSGVAVSTG